MLLSAFTKPVDAPESVAACKAAPMATHSSGLMDADGSLPVSLRTCSCTAGMRVEPPTRSTHPSSDAAMPASLRAVCTGPEVRSTKSRVMSLNAARVSVVSRCAGPAGPCARNGRLTCVDSSAESSFFASRAASATRRNAILSRRTSMPCSRWNASSRYAITRSSKSSPPKWLSPDVASTSMTSSPISMMDTSNVPPPRSYTITFCGSPLSSPYASAAAVGSLMMRSTSRPAMRPASFVAWRCASSKYAGTVMTACVTS